MKMKSTLLALAAAAAMSQDNPFYSRVGGRDYSKNSAGKSKEELNRDKGLTEFHYPASYSNPQFTCWALNQKSADKKYAKWRKQNGY